MPPTKYFFIDESGSPNFYAKRKRILWTEPNFDHVLMLGMVVVEDRKKLRNQVLDFQASIKADTLYNTIHSVAQPDWYLHASQDHQEVRIKAFEFIRELTGFEFYVIIGRKDPQIFHNKHNGNAAEFYFDLLHKMLLRYNFEEETAYRLYLSQRQSNTVERFQSALDKVLHHPSRNFDQEKFMCRIVPSKDYPELSLVDYLLWALRRCIVGEEGRFFNALREKFTEIVDVYEDGGKGRVYNKIHPLLIEKANPFQYVRQSRLLIN